MSVFALELRAAAEEQRIDGVTSFVGEDVSVSFGLLARHERFLTARGTPGTALSHDCHKILAR